MGILAFVLNKLAMIIRIFKLPRFILQFGKLHESINFLMPYLNRANAIFPVKEIFQVLKILIAFSMLMFAFWVLQKILNFIRG